MAFGCLFAFLRLITASRSSRVPFQTPRWPCGSGRSPLRWRSGPRTGKYNQATNHNNVFSLKSVFVREIMERPIIQLTVPNRIEETERTTNDSGLIAESTHKKRLLADT